jgi:hypothetical protein
MRKQITVGTLQKIREFLQKQPEPLPFTQIRDALSVDYHSLHIALKLLIQEKAIRKQKNNKYGGIKK